MNRAADMAVAGWRGGLLSPTQRQRLAQWARSAWQAVGQPGAFDAWRLEQSIRAVGCRISEASNADFLPLKAHFMSLAGRTDEAFAAALESQTEPEAWALQKLQSECAAAGVSLDYARAIARRKHGHTDLARLDAKHLWHLIFSVRRRGQKNRRGQATGANRAAAETVASVMRTIRARAAAVPLNEEGDPF
jgi:hypothetical protein